MDGRPTRSVPAVVAGLGPPRYTRVMRVLSRSFPTRGRRGLWVLVVLLPLACGGPAINRSTVVIAPTPLADPTYATAVGIRGTVRVGATYGSGGPLPGLTVVLRLPDGGEAVTQATTDSTGTFQLGPVPAGTYELAATVPRPSGPVTLWVTDRLRHVQLRIPPGGGRLEIVLLARYVAGSTRLIAAVELLEPASGQ
jgi:hypothetical protein